MHGKVDMAGAQSASSVRSADKRTYGRIGKAPHLLCSRGTVRTWRAQMEMKRGRLATDLGAAHLDAPLSARTARKAVVAASCASR